ncbi:MAG: hypothetical protein JRJ19_12790 [Deltaproteobacteria bacterium]|nr:hypothetical protein [Deltaproteobacteria bacterium]
MNGLIVALSAQQQIKRGAQLFREPYLPGLLLFELLVLVPLGTYLFIRFPAWSMLYLVEPADISSNWLITIFGCSLGLATVGYISGYFLCLRRHSRVLFVLLGLVGLGVVVFVGIAGDRLSRLGEGLDWQAAPGILTTRLGIIFAFILPLVLGGMIFLIVLFGMEGRKMRRARIGTVREESLSQPRVLGPTSAYPSQLNSKEVKLSVSELEAAVDSVSKDSAERESQLSGSNASLPDRSVEQAVEKLSEEEPKSENALKENSSASD